MTAADPALTVDDALSGPQPQTDGRSAFAHTIADSLAIANRYLIAYKRLPQLLVFSTIQPIMFVLLFRYVFGGAIRVPGGDYASYLLPGVFVQTVVFGSSSTAIGLAMDMRAGIIDRFRSLPMARSAVLAGRTTADLVRNLFVILLMVAVGYLVGFRFHGGLLAALGAMGIALLFGYAFSWFFALVGLLVKDVETAQVAGFVPLFPLVFASSVFASPATMPSWLRAFAEHQPITKVTNAVRGLALGTWQWSDVLVALLWIGAILVVFAPLAIRLRTPVASCGHALAPNAERHLRSRGRLSTIYPPELLARTLDIADACGFSLDELRYEYPDEVVPREVYDSVIEILIGLKALRLRITHQIVSNSVYSMLISDVLYHGIKDFVLTENMLAKNIPGASSLVKLGRKSLNVAAPKLETGIDKQLVKFINANIQTTIAQSETFLDNTLDAPTMRKLGGEVWDANAARTMAEVCGDIDAAAVDAAIDVARQFWLHYRQTELFHALVAEIVEGFFERYGERDVRALLEEMGVTQDVILEEAYAFAIPVIERGLETGYLERRIRKRLGAFYAQYEE